MNRIYRVVWSASLGMHQVASEVAGGHGGTSRSADHRRVRKAAVAAVVAAASLNTGPVWAIPLAAIMDGRTFLVAGQADTTSSTNWRYDGTILSITGTTFAQIANTFGTISNAGTLVGGNALLISSRGNVMRLENSGLIFSPSNAGIDNAGTLASAFNSGSISAANGYGVENTSHLGQLTNTGTISGRYGVASFMGSVSTQLGTLTNSGTITGAQSGVMNRSATLTTIDNLPLGLIDGTSGLGSGAGIDNRGTVIGGTTYHGIIGTINNAGTISGGNYGIYNEDSIGTINNLAGGLISSAGEAIANASAAATIGQINNAGIIAGNISHSGTQALSIAGASGAAQGTLTGFGSAIPGTLSSSLADIHFNGGNLLLNDHLNLAGTRTAFNDASVLQVNNAIQVSGDYAQAAGATLQIGVAGNAVTTGDLTTDSGYGRLVVSGNTTLAAGSSIALQSLGYSFAAGQRYVVIDTAGSATYNEGSLVYRVNGSSTLGATGATVANGSRQDLVVTLISDTNAGSDNGGGTGTTPPADPRTNALLASAPNAQSSLRGLLGYTGVSDAQLLNLYNAALGSLSGGSTDSANRVGKQLAPAQNTRAAGAATFESLGVVGAHVNSLRVAQAGGTGIATGDSAANWGVWGQAFGGHASQSARNDVDGYSANYGGLVIGADRAFGERWRAGGAVQFSRTAIDNDGSTSGNATGVNGYGLIGYAAYTGEPWYVNLSGSAVLQHYDTTRSVSMPGFNGVAHGNFNGQQYVFGAEFGWPLALGRAIVTPLAGVTYGYLNQNGYTETGGNGSALTVGRVGVSSVRSALGAKLALPFETARGMWVPELSVRWLHEYNRTRQTTGASFAADPSGQTAFTTVGATPVSDLADISLGLTLMKANNLSASIRYDLQAGAGFVSHTGIVRVQQRF